MKDYLIKKEDIGVSGVSWDEARVVLLGAPFDGASSYRFGSRFAPGEIRKVMDVLEEFSITMNGDLRETSFYDAGDLVLPPDDHILILDKIKETVAEISGQGKIPLLLGGDHTVTIGAVKGILQHIEPRDLVVMQLDAHADLRDAYLGEEFSHACVMRRILDMNVGEVIQLGIRSVDAEEMEIIRRNDVTFYPYQVLEPLRRVLPSLKGRPVYVTIDIDVVDPGMAPGTGTPEPGGITSGELLHALCSFKDMNIIGIDLVEVSPPSDLAEITTILGAKILRELLIMLGTKINS